MKKVLIIGYFWPYLGGSGRIPGFAKHLPESGWQPTILTAPLGIKPIEKFNYIETSYSGDIFSFWRKILRGFGFETKKSVTEQIKLKTGIKSKHSFIDWLRTKYQEIFAFPDTEKKWYKPALVTARKLLKKEKFDAIISVWPVISHLIAKRLKEEYQIPWVADFPDPWSENHAYPYGKIRKFFDRKLEIKTIASADVITAASPGYARKEENLHQRPAIVITHGFDPESLPGGPVPLTKKFTITYTGTIYPQKQDPTKLFLAIKELIDEKEMDSREIEIRFYGNKYSWLDLEIQKYALKNIAIQYGSVSKKEVIKRQAESQILLLLCWEDLKETGVYTLKTFEYLASQRPILATGGSENEDIKKIIEETKSGVSAITVDEIKDCLKIFYQEYKRTGGVSYRGDPKKIEQYSYQSMAKKFADVLNQITNE